jgi:hypothetical protein
MMTGPYFEAEDAPPLLPLGTCSVCLSTESPEIAVFWSQDDLGAVCPTCSGESPGEGYSMIVCVARRDKKHAPETMLGPYSPAEAARVCSYLLQLDNISDARVAPKPEWWK